MNLSNQFKGTYGTMYYVNDMAKAVAYYKDKLNVTPVFESPEWTEFNFGGANLCLHGTRDGQKVDGKGILILRVTGIREMVAEMKKRGVEISDDVREIHPGAWAAHFRDPSGNDISIYEDSNQHGHSH